MNAIQSSSHNVVVTPPTQSSSELQYRLWYAWTQEMLKAQTDWATLWPHPTSPEEIRRELGQIFQALSKTGSGPLKQKLIALAHQLEPSLAKEWFEVYEDCYRGLCTLAVSRFESLSREQAMELVQPFALQIIPWALLKVTLLNEPPLHETMKAYLREHALDRNRLLLLLWSHIRFPHLNEKQLETQLHLIHQKTGWSPALLQKHIQSDIREWMTEKQTTLVGRQELLSYAEKSLGAHWEQLLQKYPSGITPWELFRRLYLQPPIQWRSYLNQCMFHACKRYLREQNAFVTLQDDTQQENSFLFEKPAAKKESTQEELESLSSTLIEEIHDWLEQIIETQEQEKRRKSASVWRRRLWIFYSRVYEQTPKKDLASAFQVAAGTVTSDCLALAILPFRLYRAPLFDFIEANRRDAQTLGDQKEEKVWTQRRLFFQLLLRPETPPSNKQLEQKLQCTQEELLEHWYSSTEWLFMFVPSVQGIRKRGHHDN